MVSFVLYIAVKIILPDSFYNSSIESLELDTIMEVDYLESESQSSPIETHNERYVYFIGFYLI